MRRKIRIIFTAAALAMPCALRADTYPMLEQLSLETQSLYRDVQSGLVRVQLPTPKWIREEAAKDDPLRKWGKVLDPQVKEKIAQQQNDIAATGQMRKRIEPVIVAPSTQPAAVVKNTNVGAGWNVKSENKGEIVLEPGKAG